MRTTGANGPAAHLAGFRLTDFLCAVCPSVSLRVPSPGDTLPSSSGVRGEAVQFNRSVSAMPELDSTNPSAQVPGTADTLPVR
jgi:hypothetical protein